MKEIQMVDLVSQYQNIKEEVDAEMAKVIETASFIKGPILAEFKADLERYLSVNHVIPCANGTDALQIALMALGLQPGDEVITSNFTFAATVEVIGLLGLKPVLIDVLEDTFNLDVSLIEGAITTKTKAIIPVHLFGQCADMEPILKIAKKHNLHVIEDTAQAIGAEYTFSDGTKAFAGTMGTMGTTSFFPSKNLGCFGDGGALFTNDSALAGRLEAIVNHGMYQRYYHDEIGVNSRLDSIQAAVLKVKLKHLDTYNLARQNAASYYNNVFKNYDGLETPVVAANSSHVFHQYTLKLNGVNRDELKAHLESHNIPSMVYYPVPLHRQKAYLQDGVGDDDFPITMKLCASVLSLPMHTELSTDQLEYISSALLSYVEQKQLKS